MITSFGNSNATLQLISAQDEKIENFLSSSIQNELTTAVQLKIPQFDELNSKFIIINNKGSNILEGEISKKQNRYQPPQKRLSNLAINFSFDNLFEDIKESKYSPILNVKSPNQAIQKIQRGLYEFQNNSARRLEDGNFSKFRIENFQLSNIAKQLNYLKQFSLETEKFQNLRGCQSLPSFHNYTFDLQFQDSMVITKSKRYPREELIVKTNQGDKNQSNQRKGSNQDEQQHKLRDQRQILMRTIDQIILQAKKNSISSLKLEQILSDVKMGGVPDFGFLNELKFDDEKIGWQLFCGVIGPYPKYQKLAKYIREYQQQKQQEEYEKIFRKHHHRTSTFGTNPNQGNMINLMKRSGFQKKIINQGFDYLTVNTEQQKNKSHQSNEYSIPLSPIEPNQQTTPSSPKKQNSTFFNITQPNSPWKRTISFADEVAYMKMVNAQQPSFKRLEDMLNNSKQNYIQQKTLKQSKLQKILKEKEKTLQIKYKKLKDEANQLDKEFKEHKEVIQRIKLNKVDIFFTNNPVKKEQWHGQLKKSDSSPRKNQFLEDHLKQHSSIMPMFNIQNDKVMQTINYNIFNRILHKISEEEINSNMIQQRVLQAFANYLDNNFKSKGKDAYSQEAEKIKKSLKQKGIDETQFDSYLYVFPDPPPSKKRQNQDHQSNTRPSFQADDGGTLQLPLHRVSKRISVKKGRDSNPRKASKLLTSQHSPSELQLKQQRSYILETDKNNRSKSNFDVSFSKTFEQRESTKTNQQQYVDQMILASPSNFQTLTRRDPILVQSFNASPNNINSSTMKSQNQGAWDLKYNIKIVPQESLSPTNTTTKRNDDFSRVSQKSIFLTSQYKSQKESASFLTSQRDIASRSSQRVNSNFNTTTNSPSFSQIPSPTSFNYYSSQVNSNYRLNYLIYKLKNIKKKLKQKCELDLDNLKKKDVKKLIVIQKLIKSLRSQKFDFDPKFLKQIQKSNLNDLLEEIKFIEQLMLQQKEDNQIEDQKQKQNNQEKKIHKKSSAQIPKRLKEIIRSKTPFFDQNYRVNSYQRRDYLSKLEQKLDSIKTRGQNSFGNQTQMLEINQDQSFLYKPIFPESMTNRQQVKTATPIKQRLQISQTAQPSPREDMSTSQVGNKSGISNVQLNKMDLNINLKHQIKPSDKMQPIKLKPLSQLKIENLESKGVQERGAKQSSSTVTRFTKNQYKTSTTVNQGMDNDSKSMFKTIDDNQSLREYLQNNNNSNQSNNSFNQSPTRKTQSNNKSLGKQVKRNQPTTTTNINININQTYFCHGELQKLGAQNTRGMTPKRQLDHERIDKILKDISLDNESFDRLNYKNGYSKMAKDQGIRIKSNRTQNLISQFV